MYSPDYGTHLAPVEGWPYKTWLAMLHTGDNHGPPRPEEVKKVLDEAAQKFPGVKVRIGRLSDFADAIVAEKANVPVLHGDAPDTWIHGPMADPAGCKLARNLRPLIAATEALNTQLRAWGVTKSNVAPAVTAAYEQSLLFGEHTWGGTGWWAGFGHIDGKMSYGEQFHKDDAAGRFKKIEDSWDEHTAYIQKAKKIITPVLKENLDALARGVGHAGPRIVVYNPLPWKRDGVVTIKAEGTGDYVMHSVGGGDSLPVERVGKKFRFIARDVPPTGYRTYVLAKAEVEAMIDVTGNTIQTAQFRVTLDPAKGTVRSLVEKASGRELVDSASTVGLGQYLYERFDTKQMDAYCNAYLRGPSYVESPVFNKISQRSAEQLPYEAASPKDFQLHVTHSPVSVTAVMDAKAQGKMPAVTTRVVLYRQQPYVDMEITLHNKPADPWAEAGWLCLPLKVDSPQFRLGRVGSVIDPTRDILPGANRHVFGINSGVAVYDGKGQGVGICPMDSPVVSLDSPGCWKYTLDFVPRKPVVYVNLFNNQWNTNFRLWNSGTWTSRVRIWPIGNYKPEAELISPSLEARYPLQAARADGPGGKTACVATRA